jgi:Bacterial RNA polymerase, alpha chain C terminal domain
MRPRRLIASPPWTAEDDDLLRSLMAAGTSTVTIASRLSRSQSAVRHRARKFGILLPAARKGPKPKLAPSGCKGRRMNEKEKNTAPGLSSAERKNLRAREAQEAIVNHEDIQQAFHENRERLRAERLVREAAEGPMLAPTPELLDDTPIDCVIFSTRIQNALRAAGLKTVGEVREVSDGNLISLPDFGKSSLSDLRDKLGLPSTDGVRPTSKKA